MCESNWPYLLISRLARYFGPRPAHSPIKMMAVVVQGYDLPAGSSSQELEPVSPMEEKGLVRGAGLFFFPELQFVTIRGFVVTKLPGCFHCSRIRTLQQALMEQLFEVWGMVCNRVYTYALVVTVSCFYSGFSDVFFAFHL